jgi:transcriptional regulator with PAS, ATPase and Fis domain
MLPSAQVNLLRFLEEKEIYKVGGTEKKSVDVRVIAATNQSLEEAITAGKFRSDLFYRLNVAKIFLPPLRDRKLDIVPLSLMFMNRYNNKFGKRFQGLSAGAEKALTGHQWPGNIRELRNIIERVVLMEDDKEIKSAHLSFLSSHKTTLSATDGNGANLTPTGLSLDQLNKKLIEQALQMAHGNKSKAAKLLGISRPTMIYRLEKYGIHVDND